MTSPSVDLMPDILQVEIDDDSRRFIEETALSLAVDEVEDITELDTTRDDICRIGFAVMNLAETCLHDQNIDDLVADQFLSGELSRFTTLKSFSYMVAAVRDYRKNT